MFGLLEINQICDYTNSTAGKFMGSIQFTFNVPNYNVVELNGQTGSSNSSTSGGMFQGVTQCWR